MAKVKQAQESQEFEEPKSKREHVDEEHKLMSPNEKKTLQG